MGGESIFPFKHLVLFTSSFMASFVNEEKGGRNESSVVRIKGAALQEAEAATAYCSFAQVGFGLGSLTTIPFTMLTPVLIIGEHGGQGGQMEIPPGETVFMTPNKIPRFKTPPMGALTRPPSVADRAHLWY